MKFCFLAVFFLQIYVFDAVGQRAALTRTAWSTDLMLLLLSPVLYTGAL